MSGETLSIENVTAGHVGRSAIRDVTFALSAGEVVCVEGANGSGKSTLARAIAGLHPITSGRIAMHRHDVTMLSPWARSRLGLRFLPQSGRVFGNLTVGENVRLLGRGANVDVVGMEWARGVWNKPAGNLSGGRQSLLAIAAVVASASAVLLLDEPVAGLDSDTVPIAFDIARSAVTRGASIVTFEHRNEFLLTLGARSIALAMEDAP